jgi:hypothetical protein
VIDGVHSAWTYVNTASARFDARKPQRVTERGLIEPE